MKGWLAVNDLNEVSAVGTTWIRMDTIVAVCRSILGDGGSIVRTSTKSGYAVDLTVGKVLELIREESES